MSRQTTSSPRPRRPLREHLYTDSEGTLIARKLRWRGRGPRFSWCLPDGTKSLCGLDPGLYRRPAVNAAVQAGGVIWLTEGESDADTLSAMDLTATTGPHGASWSTAYTGILAGASTVIVADRDLKGANHARAVATELIEAGCTVTILVPPWPQKDVTELIAAGRGLDDLEELTDDTDVGTPRIRLTKDGRPAFVMIPGHWISLLDPYCCQLMMLLDFGEPDGSPVRGRNKVAKRLSWQRGQTDLHLGHVEDCGIVTIERRGQRQAIYHVNNPSRTAQALGPVDTHMHHRRTTTLSTPDLNLDSHAHHSVLLQVSTPSLLTMERMG